MADMISAYISGKSEERAAQRASDAQVRQAELGISETRRAEGQAREDLSPYTQAGMESIAILSPYYQAGLGAVGGLQDIAAGTSQGYQGMRDIAGMNSPEAQQAEMNRIAQSPYFLEQVRQGELGMLQNASATGGLRGGNLQAALAQFRPQMMNDAIERQYGKYAQLAGMGGNIAQYLSGSGMNIGTQIFGAGQASAAGVGAQAMQSAGQISDLMGGIGQAQAGAALASNRGLMRANEAHQSTLNQAAQFASSMMGGGMR